MPTDLEPIIAQLEQDRVRLRDLINGDVNDTVQLETRVEKSIAGQIAQRIAELAIDLNDAIAQALLYANNSEQFSLQSQDYRDQAQVWAESVITDITISAGNDLLITLASGVIINAGNVASAGYSASDVLVSSSPDVYLDAFLDALVEEIRGNTVYWQGVFTNFIAETGNFYAINLSNPMTITLPASPQPQKRITFLVNTGSPEVHNITIARNGNTIEGLAEDMVIDSSYPRRFNLEYNGFTWLVYI